MKFLITGAAGFVGKSLVRHLSDKGHCIFALDQKWTDPVPDELKQAQILNSDITNHSQLTQVLASHSFDGVFHLAAQASVKESWINPPHTYHINVTGTAVLLEVLKTLSHVPKLLMISSGEVYGALKNLQACSEQSTLKPCNPYGLSKVFAEQITAFSYPSYCIARSFSIVGKGQTENFVIPSFCRQIMEMKLNGAPKILKTGNLKIIRNFTCIEDILRAYELLMLKGESGQTYNLASDNYISLEEILEILKELSGIDFEISIDPERFRPFEPITPEIDTTLIQKLGWTPESSIKKTLSEILSFYRHSLKQKENSE